MALPLFLAPPRGDWESVLLSVGHSLRHGLRRATSLREGGKQRTVWEAGPYWIFRSQKILLNANNSY